MKPGRIIIRSLALMLVALAGSAASLCAGSEDVEHQYASLREVKLELKDFVLPTPDGKMISLREEIRGKKLILVTYFAGWCHNSGYDVETVNELYNKYRDQGLAVIGVAEYSTREELREFIEKHKPAYPICVESDDQKPERKQTAHFKYRGKAGDKDRKWGTPLSLFVTSEEIKDKGETVAKRAHIAAGELIKAEVEEFVRRQLSK
ncbi:MAG TPA: TlpA disulfide reductase family protein [Blastocatellia bacterium]|nr:TlpA disulfide reductase family protein [Blastocatellia bacterium]